MQAVMIKTKTKQESQLLLAIAAKMGFASHILSLEEMEDIGMARAIEEGRKTKFVSRSKLMKLLNKNGK